MATIVNARDVILQAASPRVGAATLPSNVTIPKTQVTGLGALADQNQVNLATQVTGMLASGAISGLGALALLNKINLSTDVIGALSAGNVSGLGTLATQNSVNGATQVTNLGSLAYANTVAANNIAAGTIAANVIFSGQLSSASGTFSGRLTAPNLYLGTEAGANNFAITNSGGGVVLKSLGTGNTMVFLVDPRTGSTSTANPGFSIDTYSSGNHLKFNATTGTDLECFLETVSNPLTVVANGGYGVKVKGSTVVLDGVVSATDQTRAVNLNADLLDGYHATAFALYGHTHSDYAASAHTHNYVISRSGGNQVSFNWSNPYFEIYVDSTKVCQINCTPFGRTV